MMSLSSVFLWLLIATSLILCFSFLPNPFEIREVFGGAILIAMLAAIPLSLTLRVISPKIMLGKVKGLHPAHRDLEKSFASLARLMRITAPKLRLFESNIPISFTAETGRPTVVMSERLLSLLTAEEIEAVMAHEFAHIKNSDTTFKALLTAYRTALPIDLIMRMIEAAFHREREILADEAAAHATRKPLCLASALLKIHRIFPTKTFSSQGTVPILGFDSTLTNRYPSMSDRINHLIRLAQITKSQSLG
jgi:Zn-dependent protease with chaperone function